MPVECERLQGFPDGWTARGDDGKPIPDTQRYKMIGNAVPPEMVEWIGRGIVRNLTQGDG
jgi:DNA (cytosine-5)-methyltransferase 1